MLGPEGTMIDPDTLKCVGIESTDQITQVVRDRDAQYGNFVTNSRISQDLKGVMSRAPSWDNMSDDKKEALHMIAHKISRIVCGDPCYKDSWVDLSGYAKRVSQELEDD